MRIKSIKLTNFKNFDEYIVKFSDHTILDGKNGSGKTSIRDAILFVLYNRTSTGGIDTDRFIKKDSENCTVELITDKHTYTRTRNINHSEFKIDNQIISKRDHVDLPSFDIFNSVFNVGYFSTLPEKTQRDIILQNTEDIDHLKLFVKAGGNLDIFEDLDIDNIPECIKSINSKKLKITKDIDGSLWTIRYLSNMDLVNDTRAEMIQSILEALEFVKNEQLISKKEYERYYNQLNQIPILEMKQKSAGLVKLLKKEFKSAELILTTPYKSKMVDKDIFRFEINGLEYKQLSNGEKLRFDLVISKFLNSLKPIDLFFIDDTHVLDDFLEDLPDQSIMTQISPYNLTTAHA